MAQPCSFKLINELVGPLALTLSALDGTVLAGPVAVGARGCYGAPVECGAALLLVDVGSGDTVFALPPAELAPGGIATVFAFGSSHDGTADAFLATDASAVQLPDGPGSIDRARVRVCSALDPSLMPGGAARVQVQGVVDECYTCSRPLFARATYGACSTYADVGTTWPWLLGVGLVDAGGRVLTTSPTPMVAEPLEHGYYTLVLRTSQSWSPDAAALIAFGADVEGRNAYWPLAMAAGALVVLVFALCALRRLGVCYLANRFDAPQIVQQGKAATAGRVATLVTFLGIDEALATRLATRKSGGDEDKAGGTGSDSGSINAERLLAPDGVDVVDGTAAAAPQTAPALAPVKHAASRVASIDAFRGLCLCGMIFVNYGGGQYLRIEHAPWNGLAFADVLFPTFVWLSGVSMAISFASERRRGATRLQLAQKTAVRAAKLYALGLWSNGGNDWMEWRVTGVLQYFSVSYLIVGLAESFLGLADAAEGAALPSTLLGALRLDLTRYWAQWLAMGAVVSTFLAVQQLLPLPPGCPTGYVGAGGLADQGLYIGLGCTGGAARAVDQALFTFHHIYHRDNAQGVPQSTATCSGVYACDIMEPEGALGWLMAAFLCFLGLQAGRVFVHFRGLGHREALRPFATRWLLWAGVCLLLGGALCGFKKEGGFSPLNKNLWSLSFVTVVSGMAFAFLALLFALIDALGVWAGDPMVYVGMNSILIYVGHGILSRFPMTAYTHRGMASHAEALRSNLVGVLCWVCVARYLFLRKWFVVI